ncbi:MAG: DUF362 domain-containing protein, partial [Candidatus Cloacimonetes bacterium]|nr:DUF362 domain-containing protein [Candidatus Cloacimonadota bacterium]
KKTGILSLAEKHNIKLLNFKKGEVIRKKSSEIEFFQTKYFWKADAVINVAKYKTHSLMNYTGAVKNLYGIIPGLQKSEFHKKFPSSTKFTDVISRLYSSCKEKVVLNIIDGIWGMEGEGPSAGIPRNFGVLFVSEEASSADYIAASCMGFKQQQIEYVMSALSADEINPDQIEIPNEWKGFKFKKVKIKRISPFLRIISHAPDFIWKPIQNLYKYYPDFNNKCIKCNICVKTCPVSVMTFNKIDDHPVIDHNNCIKCMCCHEVCPEQAIFIHRNYFARSMIK